MTRAIRSALWRLLAAATLACSGGENPPGNDTSLPEPSPAAGRRPAPVAPWRWDARVGDLFAVPGPAAGTARLVRPEWTDAEQLDSLSLDAWPVEGMTLQLLAGAAVVGTSQLSAVRVDSSCIGWPVADLTPTPPGGSWRVAFAPSRVSGLPLDSLPGFTPADSAATTTTAARAASRLPDDTATAFRGRPFIVRQATRFPTGDGSTGMMVEIVRMVSQEANPLQEQILMLLETRPGQDAPATAFHVRTIGLEENLSSVELVAAIRVIASNRLVVVLRRERDAGSYLQWIERVAPGRWSVTWQGALDGC